MDDFTVQKLPSSAEVSEFLRKAVATHPAAECALLIMIDEEDCIVGLGSNRFPFEFNDSFVEQLNTMLRAIHDGKGLQS